MGAASAARHLVARAYRPLWRGRPAPASIVALTFRSALDFLSDLQVSIQGADLKVGATRGAVTFSFSNDCAIL